VREHTALSIVAPAHVMAALQNELAGSGVRYGKPKPAKSPADALDSPIGAEELKLMLEVATFIVQTGPVAVGAFRKAVKKVLAEDPETPMEVIDPNTGESLGTFTYANADDFPVGDR
jgi:hypothetical protein